MNKKAWVSVAVIGLAGLMFLVSIPSISDGDWTGFWSTGVFPGGTGDMADRNLPDVSMRLEMYSRKGHLTGMIAADQICLSKPFTAFLLFDGKAKRETATITAYDSTGGQRTDLVKIELARDGTALTVVPVEGHVEWLPKITRVERDLESDWIERNNFGDSCALELT